MKYQIYKKTNQKFSWQQKLISPIFALLIALLVSTILLLAINQKPWDLFSAFFIEPLSSVYGISEVLMKASVLIIIALGLAVGFQANVWNIGAEGQFVFGALSGGIVALYFEYLPSFILIPMIICAGAFGGMFYAAIPAFLKTRFATNEILSSLMLVYIAELLLSYCVYGPLQAPEGQNFPQSAYFSDNAIFPIILNGTRLSITPLFVILITPLIYLLLVRSYFGFQLKIMGSSKPVANYSGFNCNKMVWFCFLISGFLAGVAGISEVSANISQLVPNISPGYGFTAIIVAFLGRLHPIGIIFSGLLMALLYIGSEAAQISLGLPIAIGGVFQGLILFSLLGTDFFLKYRIARTKI